MTKFETAVAVVKNAIKTYNSLTPHQRQQLGKLGQDILLDMRTQREERKVRHEWYTERFNQILGHPQTDDPLSDYFASLTHAQEEEAAENEHRSSEFPTNPFSKVGY